MNDNPGIVRRVVLIADVVLTVFAFAVVWKIHQAIFPPGTAESLGRTDYYPPLLLVILIWYVALDFLNVQHHYGKKMTAALFDELFKAVTISIFISVFLKYFLGIRSASIPFIFVFYLLDLALLTFSRFLIYRFVTSKRKEDSNRYILVIGSRTTAQELVRQAQNEPGLSVVGCLEPDKNEVGKEVSSGVKVIGTLDDLRRILTGRVVDEVLVTMPLNEIENAEWHLSCINGFGIVIRIIPPWYLRKFMTIHSSHTLDIGRLFSEPAFVLNRISESRDSLVLKSIIDYALALVMILAAAPLFILFPLLIKAFSPGPAFYKQIRCGRFGRRFPIFKFRTMIPGAQERQYTLIELNEADGPAFKIRKDPRIIPYIGTFLRKFGLDELPQLINVIRGEMSLVGPRPPTPEEVEKYELWQRRRLSMKPGITCIWQIHPRRNEVSFEKWMNMDMAYIDHWSLGLDLKILIKTIPAVLLGQGR